MEKRDTTVIIINEKDLLNLIKKEFNLKITSKNIKEIKTKYTKIGNFDCLTIELYNNGKQGGKK